jgi:O-antigen/teichoic acid export membrane protein
MAESHNSETPASTTGNPRASEIDAASSAEAVRTPNAGAGSKSSGRRSPNVAQATLLGSSLTQLGTALLVTIYLARELSPAAFGFFSLVGTILTLARKFLDLGLSNIAAREVTRQPERERPILEGMMAYRRAVGVALAAGMTIFAFLQNVGSERYVLLAVGVVLLFTEPAALDPVFQVRQAQAGPAVLNVMGGLLVLGGSVLFTRLAVAGPDFAWLLVIREAIVLLVTMILANRLLGYRPKPGFRGRELRTFIGPALTFGLASLVYTVYFHCDVFFVYALRGQEELGAYAAAYRPINPMLTLPWLLMVPMIPVLTKLAAGNRELFVQRVRNACSLALGIGACGLVAGTILAPDLVHLLYHGRYLEGPLSCVRAFQWLAIALGQVWVTTVLSAALLADRKEKVLLTIGACALVVNAVINMIALRYYNFTAAGVATAATELLFLIGALVAFYLATQRSPLAWSAVKYLLPAIVLAGLLQWMGGGPGVRVTAGVVLGGLAVLGILVSGSARQFRKEIAADVPVF